jgi:hypothetical protein
LNMSDLEQSWEMALGSLNHSFQFACRWLRRMGK